MSYNVINNESVSHEFESIRGFYDFLPFQTFLKHFFGGSNIVKFKNSKTVKVS